MLNIDLDFAAVLSATRTPALGLGGHAMSAARARMTDLKSALGKTVDAGILRECLIAAFENEFSAELHDADLSLTEHARYRNALAEIDTPDWINLVSAPAADIQVAAAKQPRVSGAMNVTMLYDRSRRRIKQVWFTTDSGLLPSSGITGLEAVLRDTSVERLERNVHAFFAAGHELQSLKASEIISLLRRVLQLPLVVPHP
jgi:lipoate-protein ligase A